MDVHSFSHRVDRPGAFDVLRVYHVRAVVLLQPKYMSKIVIYHLPPPLPRKVS
jgi:hypothetical protein